MCGIAGGFGSPSTEVVKKMVDLMPWRGPDDRGFWQQEGIVFGHNRLTIIDLDTGRQPLFNEDRSIAVVFNGEIYNYRELRADLEAKGHVFSTKTDTEVLVHLYEEMGCNMIQHLDGMFAFVMALPDGLFMARDPLGIKPLYLGWSRDDTLYFASELKALFPFCVKVQEFPNGHYYDGRRFTRYWHLPANGDFLHMALDEVKDRVRKTLFHAVRKRLVADVPVGVFLSGGLDSSLIAAMAREMVEGELHSFAVGLKGCADLAYSKVVAAHLGTVHHTYEYNPEEVITSLPEVINHLESFDPALVRSAIPTYFVSRLAARYVKVVLSGEGADEVFGGYAYLRDLDPGLLNKELRNITAALHNTNLQRVDRMTMAHSIEGRVPFLDQAMVKLGLMLSGDLKIRQGSEKWILRKVAEDYLPQTVAWRKKEKFAHGTGTSNILAAWATKNSRVRGQEVSHEETVYRKIFRSHFGHPAAEELVGRTRSVVPGEIC